MADISKKPIAAAAAAPAATSGSAASGAKMSGKSRSGASFSIIALLSRVYASPNVRITVDVPLEGSAVQRLLAAQYAVYATEKAAQKLYRSADYGAFNPRMLADGVEEISACYASAPSPTAVRIYFTAKPHKAAQLLAKLMARLQIAPPASDLSSPSLAIFPRDINILHAAASRFYDALTHHAAIAVIGGKRAAIRGDFIDKLVATYDKRYKQPALSRSTAASASASAASASAAASAAASTDYSFSLDLSSAAKGGPSIATATAVVVAHIVSGWGSIWMIGGKIALTTDLSCAQWVHRTAAAALSSMSRASALLAWYERQAAKDKLNGQSLGTVLAVAGICTGLPIAAMQPALLVKTMDIPLIAKAVAGIGAELKAQSRPAIPHAAPSAAPSTKPAAKPAAKMGPKARKADSFDSDSGSDSGSDSEMSEDSDE